MIRITKLNTTTYEKDFNSFIISGLLISCSTTKRSLTQTTTQESTAILSENDGSSYEKAIIIDVQSESKGISAEYTWLKNNYPGYRSKGQALNFYKKNPYDIITILTAEGIEKKIYFDISKFYGKF